jgi:hypothetical protein
VRKTLTLPLMPFGTQRNIRLFGISLQIRKFPSRNQQGPSAQRQSLKSSSFCAVPTISQVKRLS